MEQSSTTVSPTDTSATIPAARHSGALTEVQTGAREIDIDKINIALNLFDGIALTSTERATLARRIAAALAEQTAARDAEIARLKERLKGCKRLALRIGHDLSHPLDTSNARGIIYICDAALNPKEPKDV